MHLLWPVASRSLLRTSRTCSTWGQLAEHRTCTATRIFSTCTESFRRPVMPHIRPCRSQISISPTLRAFASKSKPSSRVIRTKATSTSKPVIADSTVYTTYEDLPIDYKDESGLPFRSTPLSKDEIAAIFGRGNIILDADSVNNALRILHGRRVAGTLKDPSLPTLNFNKQNVALAWLRDKVPVDEEDSAAKRAEEELAAMDAALLSTSERIGLYKPNAGEAAPKGNFDPKSVYGRSGLDEIREQAERKLDAREKAEEERRIAEEAASQQNLGPLMNPRSRQRSQVELRRPGQNPRLQYYLDRAAEVVPDKPPEMSAFQRLWPSTLVMVLVLGASYIFTQVYVPPSHGGRLFPELPPAAATILAVIGVNTVIWALWHIPPAFRMLNKYFLSVPGYPRGLAILGNVFSHQNIGHLFLNMLVLWYMGTRLHDDIGRANFLALYFSSGTVASFASLAYFVRKRNFATASLGASGAISGVVASYLWLHKNEYFKIFSVFPPEPMRGVSGNGLLGFIVALEILSFARGKGTVLKFDHVAHLGGYGSGIAMAELIDRSVKRKRLAEKERRKNMSITDRIKDWRT